MREIAAENINENIFKLIGKDWMLVAAQKDGKTNAMTASWGFAGVMWGKNCRNCLYPPSEIYKGIY